MKHDLETVHRLMNNLRDLTDKVSIMQEVGIIDDPIIRYAVRVNKELIREIEEG